MDHGKRMSIQVRIVRGAKDIANDRMPMWLYDEVFEIIDYSSEKETTVMHLDYIYTFNNDYIKKV